MSLSQIVRTTSFMSNCPSSLASEATKTTCRSRSPASSRMSGKLCLVIASASSYASSVMGVRRVSSVCFLSQGQPSGARRRSMMLTISSK